MNLPSRNRTDISQATTEYINHYVMGSYEPWKNRTSLARSSAGSVAHYTDGSIVPPRFELGISRCKRDSLPLAYGTYGNTPIRTANKWVGATCDNHFTIFPYRGRRTRTPTAKISLGSKPSDFSNYLYPVIAPPGFEPGSLDSKSSTLVLCATELLEVVNNFL